MGGMLGTDGSGAPIEAVRGESGRRMARVPPTASSPLSSSSTSSSYACNSPTPCCPGEGRPPVALPLPRLLPAVPTVSSVELPAPPSAPIVSAYTCANPRALMLPLPSALVRAPSSLPPGVRVPPNPIRRSGATCSWYAGQRRLPRVSTTARGTVGIRGARRPTLNELD